MAKTEKPPWLPAEYDNADAAAIQALQRGTATAEQQKRALNWIIITLAKTYDLSYRPGRDGDTDFAEGKRFVGLQLVKLANIKIGLLKKEE